MQQETVINKAVTHLGVDQKLGYFAGLVIVCEKTIANEQCNSDMQLM